MKRMVTLNKTDEIILNDVLEYILCDDKERDDFLNKFGEEYFDDNMVLQLNEVCSKGKNHIYYKTEFLRHQLIEVTHGF